MKTDELRSVLKLYPSESFTEPCDHVLIRNGLCSERSFQTFIKNHKVEIYKENEKPCDSSNSCSKILIHNRLQKINSDKSRIYIDGNEILNPKHLYILFNKPCGVVCSKVSDSHKTVFDFMGDEIKSHPFYEKLHSAGRLDSDSRGLVLLTTNGSFSNFLTSPETHEEKEYLIKLHSKVSKPEQNRYIKAFKNGLELPPEKKGYGFTTKPAHLEFLDSENEMSCKAFVRISEGKFRQIRRMFFVLGNEVEDLFRLKIGKIEHPENLSEGEYISIG